MIKKTKILLLFLISFQAYGDLRLYPVVNNTSPVFQLPPQQRSVQILPWCPYTSGMTCANALASQAQLIPHLSTQSYSVPMILLNQSLSSNKGGVYDSIRPSLKSSSRKRKRNRDTSESYFRNVDTGHIQVKKDGEVVGEGPLVFIPSDQLQPTESSQSPSITTPSNAPDPSSFPDSNPFPTPVTEPKETEIEQLAQQLERSLRDNTETKNSQQPKEDSTNEEETASLSSHQAVEIDTSSGLRVVETELPEELKDHCLIGGLLREKKIGGKCPTKGNSCPSKSDGFRCGPIFNSVCISRTPIKNLSKRCAQKSGDIISEENYKKLLENDPVAEFCKINSTKANCRNYPNISQLSQVEQEAGVCEDCDATSKTNVSPENQAVSDVIDASLTHDFTDILSESLYTRAACNSRPKCSTHGVCSPWSRDNDPCRISCSNIKDVDKSKNKCAGYTVHSLNLTLREYFKDYCKKHKKKEKCHTNSNSICEKNFVFHHGLCALNLDGKDRIDGNSIEDGTRNTGVRGKCNETSPGFPTHITNDDGESIPLFKEISMPKDPKDLPEGAIVVSKTKNTSGHVEVKTNKSSKFCSEDDTCFCSDFCTGRSSADFNGGYFDAQVVFVLNPEAAAEAKKAKGYSNLTTSFPFLQVFFPPNSTQGIF